jgi:predicted hydrocarbon binding protein
MIPPGYILIRPETLAGVQKAAEAALGPAAGECLAAGGRAGGGRATAALEGDAAARVTRLLAQGSALGWGTFALERLTPTALAVSVTGSPFARAYGGATAPVCHLTRGVLEALAATVLQRPRPVRETACAALGAPRCHFETLDDAMPPRGLPETVSHPAQAGGEMGGTVSHPAQAGGEMGGTPTHPHTS